MRWDSILPWLLGHKYSSTLEPNYVDIVALGAELIWIKIVAVRVGLEPARGLKMI